MEGVEDVLSPEIEKEAALYANARCPNCFQSGHAVKRLDPPRIVAGADGRPEVVWSPFSKGRMLTDGYAHCQNCETDFCPRSGIIRKTNDLTDAPPISPRRG